MAYEDRQKTVDDFNSDAGQFVFLISTKAGGLLILVNEKMVEAN